MGEIKLLGAFASFYAYRVEWALVHKGIKYEYIDEDIKNKSPLLLKCNPVHKKVPVLLHGEKSIAESLVILEYIDETWKENPLLPQDPLERAKARFWAKFADEKFLPSILTASYSEGKEREKALEESLEALKILEEELKGKEFFGGESVGFVDLVVGWIPHWLPLTEEVFGFSYWTLIHFHLSMRGVTDSSMFHSSRGSCHHLISCLSSSPMSERASINDVKACVLSL